MLTFDNLDFDAQHIDVEAFWRDQGFDSLEAVWLEATWASLEAERLRSPQSIATETPFELISDE